MGEKKGLGRDDLKKNIYDYQKVIAGTTRDGDDFSCEVLPAPTPVEDSGNDDCISELPSSIQSDSNEHDAFYV